MAAHPPETGSNGNSRKMFELRKEALKHVESMAPGSRNFEVSDYLTIELPQRSVDKHFARSLTRLAKKPQFGGELPQFEAFATALSKVSRRLSRIGLDYLTRALLSKRNVYMKLIADEKPDEKTVSDTLGFSESLLRAIQKPGGLRDQLLGELVDEANARLKLDLNNKKKQLLVAALREADLSLAPESVERAVRQAHDSLVDVGSMPTLVDAFALAGEIEPDRFTPAVKQRMVDYLVTTGIQIDLSKDDQETKFLNGGYDEYLALAYHHATSTAQSDIVQAPATGGWNFSVDEFDSIEDIAVDADNIRAAGFLDYAYEVGERLHVFELMDVLYLEWTRGTLDLAQGETASLLEHLWHDRSRRDTAEERGLAYAKALGKGETKVLDGMVVNTAFQPTWDTLMEEIAKYIAKRDDAGISGDVPAAVSRVPVYQAARELQYNLTEFASGRSKSQAAQLRSLLQSCFKVLDAPEIVEFYGLGSRRDRYTIIERLHRLPRYKSEVPAVSTIRTLAVEGNKVFQAIAAFNQAAVTEEQFDALVQAAQAWIIAKGSEQRKESGAADEPEEDIDQDFEEASDEAALDDF